MLKLLVMFVCIFRCNVCTSNLQQKINNIREKVYLKIDNKLFLRKVENDPDDDYNYLKEDVKNKNFFMYNNKYIEKFDSNDSLNHVFTEIIDYLNVVKLICYFYDKNENIFVFDVANVFVNEKENVEIKILFSVVCSDIENNILFKNSLISCENCVMLDSLGNSLYDSLKIDVNFIRNITLLQDIFTYFIDKQQSEVSSFSKIKFYNSIESVKLYNINDDFINFVCPSIIDNEIGYCMVSRVDENIK